jgi:Protein of unknown function (DUF4435)
VDDYAAYLAEEARSDVVALHQFRILYEPGKESLHFFFEGDEDSLFFMPVARRYTNVNPLHLYDCGGKKNVVEVRDAIKSDGYDIEKCLFFVDRDFDDLLGSQVVIDERTYITDGYSIENDISTIDAARIVVSEILGISQANPEFKNIENSLTAGYSVFHREVRPLIAWILAARALGCGPNLSNTAGLKGVVSIVGGVPILTKKGFKDFKRKVVVNDRVPHFSEILAWRRLLCLSATKKWVRGKYEIWFFHAALLFAIEEINTKRKMLKSPLIRIPSALKEGRIFEILGGRTSPPESLQNFLQSSLLIK